MVRAFSRRELLRAASAVTLGTAAAPLLAACGDSDDEPAAGPTTSAEGSRLNEILGIDAGAAAGDVTLESSALLALSGGGAYYGEVMSNAIRLAVKQIRSAGGTQIDVEFKDHQTGNPQAGVTAGRELGSASIHTCLTSFTADLGAMLPAIAQYEIFTLDGGGGTGVYAKGKPYFWGTRANTPDDAFPGVADYLKAEMPEVKRVAMVGLDLGPNTEPTIANLQRTLSSAGIEDLGYDRTKLGSTDFSTQIAQLRDKQPDLVFISLYGVDPGYFMKQYKSAGLDKPVLGFDFTPDAVKTGGAAFDGYMFSYDYFDPEKPTNPWAEYFVETFEREYQRKPDFYAANYYEDTFALWDLVRRVKADGGDPGDPVALQEALIAKPEFQSVYGGTSSAPGMLALDAKTHSVSKRPMGVFQYAGGGVTTLATFNIGAADFSVA